RLRLSVPCKCRHCASRFFSLHFSGSFLLLAHELSESSSSVLNGLCVFHNLVNFAHRIGPARKYSDDQYERLGRSLIEYSNLPLSLANSLIASIWLRSWAIFR